MPITEQEWDNPATTILSTIIGKTIKDICYDGLFSAPITIKFTDGTQITIDAQGDDMASTTVEDK